MEKKRKPKETIAAETVRFNQNEASCRTKPPHCRCCWVTLLLPLIPLAAADPCWLLLLHPSRPAPSLLAAAAAAICCCLLLFCFFNLKLISKELSTTHPRSLWILTSAEAVCSTRLKKTPVDSELLTRWAPSGRRIQQKDSKSSWSLYIPTTRCGLRWLPTCAFAFSHDPIGRLLIPLPDESFKKKQMLNECNEESRQYVCFGPWKMILDYCRSRPFGTSVSNCAETSQVS